MKSDMPMETFFCVSSSQLEHTRKMPTTNDNSLIVVHIGELNVSNAFPLKIIIRKIDNW